MERRESPAYAIIFQGPRHAKKRHRGGNRLLKLVREKTMSTEGAIALSNLLDEKH